MKYYKWIRNYIPLCSVWWNYLSMPYLQWSKFGHVLHAQNNTLHGIIIIAVVGYNYMFTTVPILDILINTGSSGRYLFREELFILGIERSMAGHCGDCIILTGILHCENDKKNANRLSYFCRKFAVFINRYDIDYAWYVSLKWLIQGPPIKPRFLNKYLE